MKGFTILIRISLKYLFCSPTDNKPSLDQIMACRLSFEPVMAKIGDACKRHSASIIQCSIETVSAFNPAKILGILTKAPSGGCDIELQKPVKFAMSWRLVCTYVTIGLLIVV